MSTCPHCHQSIGTERLGVGLTPLKAGIIDQIQAAGAVGISSAEIIASDLYRDRRPVDPATIKSHVNQVNDLLVGGDFRIRSDRRRWYIERTARMER